MDSREMDVGRAGGGESQPGRAVRKGDRAWDGAEIRAPGRSCVGLRETDDLLMYVRNPDGASSDRDVVDPPAAHATSEDRAGRGVDLEHSLTRTDPDGSGAGRNRVSTGCQVG